jgi:hypothetical protein
LDVGTHSLDPLREPLSVLPKVLLALVRNMDRTEDVLHYAMETLFEVIQGRQQ